MITESQRTECESLIDRVMAEREMSREVAITALTIKDQKRAQAGLGPQVDGAAFELIYPSEDTALHEDDVAKVVSFLEGVSFDRAKELTSQRIASGVFKAETKH